MATKGQTLDKTPVDINTALSLEDGKSYTIQAQGGNVRFTEQASAPTVGTTPAHLLNIRAESSGTYTAKSGEKLYAWGENGPAYLVVTEA